MNPDIDDEHYMDDCIAMSIASPASANESEHRP